MKISNLLATSGLAAFALIACGGSDDTSATTSTTSTATTATTGQGGATATVGQGGATATVGQGGATATTGQGGATATTGQGGGGGGGDPEPMLNGCTRATATDLTNTKSTTITDVSAWTFGHKACIIVTPGTQVVWQGKFVTHPLAGGPAGKADLASPISLAKPNGDAVTVITPTDNGNGQAYPYFCINHNGMQGVVYTSELP